MQVVLVLATRRTAEVNIDYLVVGLGNPGGKYKNTRHNVGFLVIDELVGRHGSRGKTRTLKGQIEISEVQIEGQEVVLGMPHTYMNLSGKALRLLTKKYRVTDFSKLIVVHDELDLAPGKVKMKLGGGSAGHKGIGSITDSLRSKDFWRIRVGIGKPHSVAGSAAGADYVLGRIDEAETMQGILDAADKVETFIAEQNA